jgi:hypothetical protein
MLQIDISSPKFTGLEISQAGSDPLRGSLDLILWHRLDSARNDITGCTIDVVFSSWPDAQLLFDASVDVIASLSLEWTQRVVSGALSGYDKVVLRVAQALFRILRLYSDSLRLCLDILRLCLGMLNLSSG